MPALGQEQRSKARQRASAAEGRADASRREADIGGGADAQHRSNTVPKAGSQSNLR